MGFCCSQTEEAPTRATIKSASQLVAIARINTEENSPRNGATDTYHDTKRSNFDDLFTYQIPVAMAREAETTEISAQSFTLPKTFSIVGDLGRSLVRV